MDIEHIALNVADPTAMASWYVQHLRMRVLRRLEAAPFTHFIADASGRTVLELYHQAKAGIPDYWSMDPMVLHVAFKVDDVVKERDRLLAAGAKIASDVHTIETGDVMAFLRDPWGVVVQLVKRQKPLM